MSNTVRAPQRDAAVARPLEKAAAPALRVVNERTPTSREKRTTIGALGVVLVGCLFIAVFGMVVFQALLMQTQSRLDVLDAQVTKQEARAQLLDRQRADLESPDRIVEAARRLNMVKPADVIHLEPGASDDTQATYDANTPAPKAVTPTTKAAPAVTAPVTTATPTTAAGKVTTPTTKAGTKAATTPTTKATTPTTTPTTKAKTATTKATATR